MKYAALKISNEVYPIHAKLVNVGTIITIEQFTNSKRDLDGLDVEVTFDGTTYSGVVTQVDDLKAEITYTTTKKAHPLIGEMISVLTFKCPGKQVYEMGVVVSVYNDVAEIYSPYGENVQFSYTDYIREV